MKHVRLESLTYAWDVFLAVLLIAHVPGLAVRAHHIPRRSSIAG